MIVNMVHPLTVNYLDQPFSILFQLQLLAFQYLQHLAFIFGIAPPFFICFYFSSFYLLLIDFAVCAVIFLP